MVIGINWPDWKKDKLGMAHSVTLDKRMNIVALTWPIFIEVLLRTALNTTDVFMLGGYSDLAVSAVGVISQIMFFLVVISMMVSTGTGILIAQYNGKSDFNTSYQVGVASILLAIVVGCMLSLLILFGAKTYIDLFGLIGEVARFGYDYLIITGSFTFNTTLGIVLTAILRSHGYSRSPMVINLIAGVLNVAGNYIALYQPWGLPVYGITGVAIATVFSQIVSTLLLIGLIRTTDIELHFQKWRHIPLIIYKKILRIGVMNAGEVLSYNLAQTAIVYFVAQMGNTSLAAYTYAQNITRISFTFSLALGQASQIQTSYYVGKGWIDKIWLKIQKYFAVGAVISLITIIVLFIMRYPIIRLFTDNQEVIDITALLIASYIFIESGRVFNLIFISALKGAGDIKYPVQAGILCMWGISVVMTYILGIHLAWGVVGACIAIGLDEWIRGLFMLRRWRSKAWTHYSLT